MKYIYVCRQEGGRLDGEREDRDKEDRKQDESAGDVLQEEKWAAEESL